MSRTAVASMFVLVVAGLSGCASPARVIKQDATSVVVSIPDNTNNWPFYYRDAAQHAAAEHIHDPVLATSQRVKVGEQTTNTSDTTRRELGGRSFGDVVTSTNTTAVADRYEYHLEFRSGGPVRLPHSNTNPPPPIPDGPAASLAPQGPTNRAETPKPAVIPPIIPATGPATPAATLPGPGR